MRLYLWNCSRPWRDGSGASWTWRLTPITVAGWDLARSLPSDFRLNAWEALLLDAETFSPDVGTVLVTTSAALEVFMAWALSQLAAASPIPSRLWNWINKRPSFWQSLRSQPHRWDGFQQLRQTRNSFSHEGVPRIGGRIVSAQQALDLLARARETVDWIWSLVSDVIILCGAFGER